MQFKLPFVFIRAALLSLVFVCHSILVVLLSLSLAAKSGGAYQSVPMTVDCFALITIAISLIHKVTHRGAEPSNTRGLLTFGVLFLMGLLGAIIIIIRIRDEDRGAFCGDFSGMANSCAVANSVLVLFSFATGFAILGFIVSYIDDLPGVIKVTPMVYPPRTQSPNSDTHSIELGHIRTKYVKGSPPWMPKQENSTPPGQKTTYNRW